MNVLILTDLSDVARNAGSYAVQFLGNIPVNFYMLYIEQFNQEPSLANEKKEVAIKQLGGRIEELQKISKNNGHKFFALYSENDLMSATRIYADEKNIDLIVMGAAHKGHSPFTIIKNHTYEVIKKIRYDILAVAEHCRYRPLEKIILPIDYSTLNNEEIFTFLKRPNIAKGAELTVVEILSNSTMKDVKSEKIISQIKERKVDVVPFRDKII